jgi:hypothetical protein
MTHSHKKERFAEPPHEAQSGKFVAKLSEPRYPRLEDYQDYATIYSSVGAYRIRPAMMYATTRQYLQNVGANPCGRPVAMNIRAWQHTPLYNVRAHARTHITRVAPPPIRLISISDFSAWYRKCRRNGFLRLGILHSSSKIKKVPKRGVKCDL